MGGASPTSQKFAHPHPPVNTPQPHFYSSPLPH